jgi:sulfatase modifying factor 1
MMLLGALLSGGCGRGTSSDWRTWNGTALSCQSLAATCGPSGNDDCCKTLLVPGGTFKRSYDGVDYLDPNYPATVSDFYLDKYEVTVGRFRVFVDAGMGTQTSPPASGAAAHPGIAGSGWNATWNTHLPASTAALMMRIKCEASYQTFTDTPGSNESRPVNCLDWYLAFAFCAWDGGRLATEAEWNYAAAAGTEQRYYPWSSPPSSTTIDDSYAVYCGGTCRVQNVGSKSPKGDGKWGQSDLGGNVWEWTLDWSEGAYPMPCHDCAVVAAGSYRAFRSGSNDDIAATLRSAVRHVYYPEYHGVVGSRCARTR